MTDNERQLLRALSPDLWTSAADLARMLGVTTRSVRNYVTRINRQALVDKPVIESSSRGYRLRQGAALPRPQETSADYGTLLIRHLIGTNEPQSVYDLADEMHVSDSTLQRALRDARKMVEPFGLTIDRHRDRIELAGIELDKRHLIAHLLVSESSQSFLEFARSGMLSRTYDSSSVARLVEDALATCKLSSNDYGLNNIVMHVIIMADRAADESLLDESVDTDAMADTPAFRAAHAICRRIAEDDAGASGLASNPAEEYSLSLVIAANSTSSDGRVVEGDNLSEFIDPQTVDITRRSIGALEEAYGLESFDENLMVRMAVHMHGLLQRARAGRFVRNPLAAETKQKYPLYYDMAVFVANEVARRTGFSICEDEIAFLSFHIGGYFEIRPPDGLRVTCAFLYLGYHNLHQSSLERIRRRFGDRISIVTVASAVTCDVASLACDVIISPVPVDAPESGAVVVVDPFVSDANLDAIDEAVRHAYGRRRLETLGSLLRRFLTADLFMRNVTARGSAEMIRLLVGNCVSLGLCEPSFADDVLAREELSSTAFGNHLAVPHSLTPSAHRSFLSVVVNDTPMIWGDEQVNIIILLGLGETDRSAFRLLFDTLLEVLSESQNVAALLGCTDYDDFATRLLSLIKG